MRGRVEEIGGKLVHRRVLVFAVAALALIVVAAASGRSGSINGAANASSIAKARALVRAAQPATLPLRSGRPFAADSTTAAQACGSSTELICSQVEVPLDRTGQVPGTISLHVEELPADGVQRGVLFLVAGGPGQGSAHVFDLADPTAAALYRYIFPGYTLVAYDDRGTGASGLLDCPALQRANTADTERAAAAACGASLGAAAPFYSTEDHALDLDAVRQSLGVDKVAVYGVSYGTKLAMAYALAEPQHVERLILASVLPPEGPDPYSADVLKSLPSTFATLCSNGACRAATSNIASDLVTVANRLGTKPLQGRVLQTNGSTRTKKVDGLDLLSIVLDADLSPGLAAELPAVLHAARNGNTQPLLRLAQLHDVGGFEPSIELSDALYAATVCRDGPFPWQPDTPPAERPAILQQAIAALKPGDLGSFGTWAARFGNADFCLGWPSPSGGAALGAGPLPNVPVLVVNGGFDMRTPLAGASSVAARFPQGQVLVVPGVGHSVVEADASGCAANGVRSWMLGQAIPSSCPRTKQFVPPIGALPAAGSANGKAKGARATYSVAAETIHEAEATWLMNFGFSGTSGSAPGIYGGKLTASTGRDFKLVGYSIARGLKVSGTITVTKFGPPLVFQGTVTVSGATAAPGILVLSGSKVRGTLAGRSVGG